MQSMGDRRFSLPVLAAGPVNVLPRRLLRVSFPLPSPLLRALGPGEQPDRGLWSDWLAEWGWAWIVTPESCAPEMPVVNLWLNRSSWPRGFEARALALAVALKLRVDGEPLSAAPGIIASDIDRVWRMVSALSQEVLGEVLALALLRADIAVFNFDSVAPSWPADVGQVVAERRDLGVDREPATVWLKLGYSLLGEAFSMVRSMGTTLDDCQEVWNTFAKGRELPLAFRMAFWWEASYCLTERHAYDDAEKAQVEVGALARTLEGLTGLVDTMWHHQQGRLFYYAGNLESALAEFLREYKTHGDDLKVAAMLNREIANVLSDMACFDAAQCFAERSVVVARSQGQRTELYKSLGRLAEIAIKLGDLASAEQLLTESLSIQEKLAEENRSPAQTLTYLGHVAILKGDLDKAAEWYGRATVKDVDKSSLPYITMGRFSLATAAANAVELDHLWNTHCERIETWATHQTHVLPAAVCIIGAAHHIAFAKEWVPSIMRALIENRYAIEAAYALAVLPEDNQAGMTRDILATLNRWQKTLGSLPPDIREITGPLNGPIKMVEAIRKSTLCDNDRLRTNCYPMTLAANVVPSPST